MAKKKKTKTTGGGGGEREGSSETDYHKFDDRPPRPPTNNNNNPSSSSTAGASKISSSSSRWKKYDEVKMKRTNSEHFSLGPSESFSQSGDFHKIFDDEDPKSAANSIYSQEAEEIYIVKQKYGYFSILFSIGQILVLICMIAGCGLAPLKINPMIGPYPDALSYWGGKNAVNIIDDKETWRLVTPIMLHAGIIHLLCNVAVQLETGAFFEREWGSTNWVIVYLVSAGGSSVLSVIYMPAAISVGSSGAVMGLFGAKLAEVIVRFCDRDKTTQARIAHQVRKEQCVGVTCSVIVVMLFSFIPYGKNSLREEKKPKKKRENAVIMHTYTHMYIHARACSAICRACVSTQLTQSRLRSTNCRLCHCWHRPRRTNASKTRQDCVLVDLRRCAPPQPLSHTRNV